MGYVASMDRQVEPSSHQDEDADQADGNPLALLDDVDQIAVERVVIVRLGSLECLISVEELVELKGVGLTVRGKEVIVPTGTTMVEPGDICVVFSLLKSLQKVQKLFRKKKG